MNHDTLVSKIDVIALLDISGLFYNITGDVPPLGRLRWYLMKNLSVACGTSTRNSVYGAICAVHSSIATHVIAQHYTYDIEPVLLKLHEESK